MVKDIPQVVTLYWQHLASRTGETPSSLHTTFYQLYFASPWANAESPSFVYEDQAGQIVGFLGIITRPMMFEAERIRVGFGGNFVVHPKARGGTAAGRLIQAMLAGNQDLLLTDSANDISKKLLERVGYRLIPWLSLHWSRPLQPSRYILHALTRGGGPGRALVSMAARPFAALADGLIGGRWNPVGPAAVPLRTEELSDEMLLQCIREFGRCSAVQAIHDAESLRWLLTFMQRDQGRGKLRKVLLRDEKRNLVGWYLYFPTKWGIGEVVQIGAKDGTAADVIRTVLEDARGHGLIALHGRLEQPMMSEYSDAGCLFTCRAGWTLAYSRRAELIDVLLRGKVSLSRLDGEWCLNPGTS